MSEETKKKEFTKEELEAIVFNSLSKLELKDNDIIVWRPDTTNVNQTKITLQLLEVFKSIKAKFTNNKFIVIPTNASLSIETKEEIIKYLQKED